MHGAGAQGRNIVVDDVRVRAIGRAKELPEAGRITEQPGDHPLQQCLPVLHLVACLLPRMEQCMAVVTPRTAFRLGLLMYRSCTAYVPLAFGCVYEVELVYTKGEPASWS